jgi:aldose sugar dehydrogenase
MQIGARFIITIALLIMIDAHAGAQVFSSSAGDIKVETVARGLEHPWSLAFLPDNRMLVTERPGRMRIVTRKGELSAPLAGVPNVVAQGQAGLMDVVIDRDYRRNGTIYFCFNATINGDVAVARAHLIDSGDPRLDAVKVIFQQDRPTTSGGTNNACRIAQGADGKLFVTLGDHADMAASAQNLADTFGKIIRIEPDGSIPPDNPFVGRPGVKPEIWAYGLRNPEGLAFDAEGKLWEQEHGPKGGDEINSIAKGKNYGWPVIGYGVNYDGSKIHKSTRMRGMEQPAWHWTPSIAPSGMTFYSGKLWRAWRGDLFNGALKYQLVSRLKRNGDRLVREERLLQGLHERIRDVREGPDGALWLLTDNDAGRILRVVPRSSMH